MAGSEAEYNYLFPHEARFKVFDSESPEEQLVNITTKDVATQEIRDSLLNAQKLGQDQVETFVQKRFIECTAMLKLSTFASLHQIPMDSSKEHI